VLFVFLVCFLWLFRDGCRCVRAVGGFVAGSNARDALPRPVRSFIQDHGDLSSGGATPKICSRWETASQPKAAAMRCESSASA